jgi:hypothetical protein
MPLALAAVKAGHEVAIAAGPDLTAHVERRGVTAWGVGFGTEHDVRALSRLTAVDA